LIASDPESFQAKVELMQMVVNSHTSVPSLILQMTSLLNAACLTLPVLNPETISELDRMMVLLQNWYEDINFEHSWCQITTDPISCLASWCHIASL